MGYSYIVVYCLYRLYQCCLDLGSCAIYCWKVEVTLRFFNIMMCLLLHCLDSSYFVTFIDGMGSHIYHQQYCLNLLNCKTMGDGILAFVNHLTYQYCVVNNLIYCYIYHHWNIKLVALVWLLMVHLMGLFQYYKYYILLSMLIKEVK